MQLHPNFRPRREHRTARHVGRLRQRLAKAIVQAFANEGVTVRCDPANLLPAQGAWRTDVRLDVMRWEGSIEVLMGACMVRQSIESWDKMSDCIKGFTIWRDRTGFEVGATEPGCSITERYVYEA